MVSALGEPKTKTGQGVISSNVEMPPVNEEHLANLRSYDATFSASSTEAMLKEWWVKLENAWCVDMDLTSQKDKLTPALFETYQSQLAAQRAAGEQTVSKDYAVTNCTVLDWRMDGGNEYLDVWLKVKKREYRVALNNPSNVLKGSPDIVYHISYKWQLVRPARVTPTGQRLPAPLAAGIPRPTKMAPAPSARPRCWRPARAGS